MPNHSDDHVERAEGLILMLTRAEKVQANLHRFTGNPRP